MMEALCVKCDFNLELCHFVTTYSDDVSSRTVNFPCFDHQFNTVVLSGFVHVSLRLLLMKLTV